MDIKKPNLKVRSYYCDQYRKNIVKVKHSLEAVFLSYIDVEKKYGKQVTHDLIEWHNFNSNN